MKAFVLDPLVLPVALLSALLLFATAAIVYVSWPLVFALIVIVAALWCWHLDQEQGEATTGGRRH